MKISLLSKPRGPDGGFSLIEVTIALGITAIALVSLMGMLPKGMETLRRAADKAIEGRIHQQVLGELQLTPWETSEGVDPLVSEFNKEIRYYDDQGIELLEAQKGEPEHVYTARIHVPEIGDNLPQSVGSTQYTGVMREAIGGTGDDLTYLRLVIVEITSIVDDRFLDKPSLQFDNPIFLDHIRTFRTFIVKMGQEYQPSGGAP